MPPAPPASLEEEPAKPPLSTKKRKKKPKLTGELLIKDEVVVDEPSAAPIEAESMIMRVPSFTPPPLPSDAAQDTPVASQEMDKPVVTGDQPKETKRSSTKRKKPKLIGPLKIVAEE